jgi:hypothetical protein
MLIDPLENMLAARYGVALASFAESAVPALAERAVLFPVFVFRDKRWYPEPMSGAAVQPVRAFLSARHAAERGPGYS